MNQTDTPNPNTNVAKKLVIKMCNSRQAKEALEAIAKGSMTIRKAASVK